MYNIGLQVDLSDNTISATNEGLFLHFHDVNTCSMSRLSSKTTHNAQWKFLLGDGVSKSEKIIMMM